MNLQEFRALTEDLPGDIALLVDIQNIDDETSTSDYIVHEIYYSVELLEGETQPLAINLQIKQ